MDDDEIPEPETVTVPQSLAFTAMADFLLILGVVFIFFGIASFITSYLKITGSGELLVGVFLTVIAIIMIMRSGGDMVKMVRRPPPPEEKMQPSESYR